MKSFTIIIECLIDKLGVKLNMTLNHYFIKASQLCLVASVALCWHFNLKASDSLGRAPQPSQCELTFGWTHYPPYQVTGENGIPSGLHIELIQAITQETNCVLNYEQGYYGDLVEKLKNGKLDFVADASITEERQQFAHFSIPYRNEAIVLYVREQYAKYCDGRDLEKIFRMPFRIGVTRGVYYGEEIERIQNLTPKIDSIVYVANRAELIKFVEQSIIDGFFEDPAVYAYETRTENRNFKLAKCKLAKFAPVSLMFSKKTVSEDMLPIFNQAIQKIKTSEKYQKDWGWKF
ncbi:amino acid ABC transporter substrate-binding protein [Aliikangiella marina]|uniref:Amino acid ABC transporter substrate-binding protein n=1 Tax=Aliikangiella marina TaxID=1712262 RepID=A0A545T331_9GAMM|nr:transporter substrate-binding domain-containing protein [Aliikangiella marina]TQV71620.1 amino acid ABC transporter substrate-binding protein [Aliikangiella marina]